LIRELKRGNDDKGSIGKGRNLSGRERTVGRRVQRLRTGRRRKRNLRTACNE